MLVRKTEREGPLFRIMFKSQENIKMYVDRRRRSGFLWLRLGLSGEDSYEYDDEHKISKKYAELFLTS